MAILQALISLISRSASTILNAIFGWAVLALFGQTSKTQQTVLSGVVGLAALWPVLLIGIAFPKVTAFAVSFVPAVARAPTGVVRIAWIALALLVPIIVGLVVASRAPPGTPNESFLKRVLRGFPITLGLAGAFLVMFVTVPILRVGSAAKGRKDEHVPLVTESEAYERVADEIDATLARHGIEALRGEPAWWMAAPIKILKLFGGLAFRGFLPEHPAFWRGAELELALYPSDLLIRGANASSAWTHGLLAEALAHGPGLQTLDADAQRVEKQIRRVWAVYDENPEAHVRSAALLSRLDEIAAECGKLKVDYDEWQVIYRQVAQLGRALVGERQLLDKVSVPKEAKMKPESSTAGNRGPRATPHGAPLRPRGVDRILQSRTAPSAARDVARPRPTGHPPVLRQAEPVQRAAMERPLAAASTRELVVEFATEATELVKKEVELAKAEIRADLASETQMAKGFGVAGVFALVVLNLLFVAAALSWSRRFEPWVCTLVSAGFAAVVAIITGLVGWANRVKVPLERTRRTLEEDVQWAKERFA